jgi:O-antigen/teichoic acid export membrane protein
LQISLFRNLLANWLGLLIGSVVGLVTTPYVVGQLGKDQYGVLTLAATLAMQLMYLDLGVRNALHAFVPRAQAANDSRELSRLLSSAGAVLAALALLGAVPLFGIGAGSSYLFAFPESLKTLATVALLLYAVDAMFDLSFSVWSATLAGGERHDLLNVANLTRSILTALTSVLLLWLGFGAYSVLSCTLVFKMGHRIALIPLTRREFPTISFSHAHFDRTTVRKLLDYGIWAFALTVTARVMYHSDTIFAGYFFGAEAVTEYAIPLLLAEQLRTFSLSAGALLTSRFSRLQLTNPGEGGLLLRKTVLCFQLLNVAVALPLLLVGDDFLVLWMGDQFSQSHALLRVLVIPYFFTTPAIACTSFMLASGAQRHAARLQVAESIVNLVLTLLLIPFFGMLGIALGTALSAVAFTGILLPLVATRHGELSLAEYLRSAFGRTTPLALFHVLLLSAGTYLFPLRSWFAFFAVNGVAFGVLMAAAYSFVLDDEDRAYFRRRVGLD